MQLARSARPMLLAVALSATAAACGSGSDSASDSAGGAVAANPVAGEAASAPDALRFTAPLVGGGQFDGAALAGKPVVFWFWAPT